MTASTPDFVVEPRASDRDPLYVVANGLRLRVHDVVYGQPPGTRQLFPVPGPARCGQRYFVPKPGEGPHPTLFQTYSFTAGEDRTPTADALARQLRYAAWAPREAPKSPTHHGT